jgi:hypothetical protein
LLPPPFWDPMQAIEIHRQWYYADGLVNGRTPLMHTGVYHVPRDISVEMAKRAIAEGVGVELRTSVCVQQLITPPDRWSGEIVVVAAPGPSLTPAVANACKGRRTIAVQDAYRLLPWADVLYGCDAVWWHHHKGCPDFSGEKWSTHDDISNDKREVAAKYGVHLIAGKPADVFSLNPAVLHYGSNSGFQAVNLAILMGAARIVLVGFDMRVVCGKRHFFGDHPAPLNNSVDFSRFVEPFQRAVQSLPSDLEILNATPGSALQCFPMVSLEDALSG